MQIQECVLKSGCPQAELLQWIKPGRAKIAKGFHSWAVAEQNELNDMNSTLELLKIVEQEPWEKAVRKRDCKNWERYIKKELQKLCPPPKVQNHLLW